jgi:hypothetical protein
MLFKIVINYNKDNYRLQREKATLNYLLVRKREILGNQILKLHKMCDVHVVRIENTPPIVHNS